MDGIASLMENLEGNIPGENVILATLHEDVHGMPLSDQFIFLMQVLHQLLCMNEIVSSFVAVVWEYIIYNQLWECSFTTASEFYASIDHKHVQKIVKLNESVVEQKGRYALNIERNWNRDIDSIFTDPALRQSRFPKNSLWHLSEISAVMSHDEMEAHVKSIVTERLNKNSDKGKAKKKNLVGSYWLSVPYATHEDLGKVVRLIEHNNSSQAEDLSTRASTPSVATTNGGHTLRNQVSSKRKCAEPLLTNESTSKRRGVKYLSPKLNRQRSAASESVSASPEFSVPVAASSTTCKGGKCTNEMLNVIPQHKEFKEDPKTGWRFPSILSLKNYCRPCLRNLGKRLFGLKTNFGTNVLLERATECVDQLHQPGGSLDGLRTDDRTKEWWTNAALPVDKSCWNFSLDLETDFAVEFDDDYAKIVMNDITGSDEAWDTFRRDGTVIIGKLFDYLGPIVKLCDHEFDMYARYFKKEQSKKMGWLRNMYMSLIQQLVVQDPVWYAIIVCLRHDHNWRLISYPYHTKYAKDGDSTGFAHVDLNLYRYLEEGLGKFIVQTSLSLNDEDVHNCTTVIPGSFKFFREWAQKVVNKWNEEKKDPRRSGPTTDLKTHWTTEDKKRYNTDLQPAPCPAFGIRASTSTTLHGTTSTATKVRRTILPWYLALIDDLSRTEVPDAVSKKELDEAYQCKRGAIKESLGSKAGAGVTEAFQPNSHLPTVCALGDAIMCRGRQWNEDKVLQDRNVVLGPNNKKRWEFIDRTRADLVEAYKFQFNMLIKMEREYGGEKSYFSEKNIHSVRDILGA